MSYFERRESARRQDVMSTNLAVRFYYANGTVMQGRYITAAEVRFWNFVVFEEADLVRLISQMNGSQSIETGMESVAYQKIRMGATPPRRFAEMMVPPTISNVMNYAITSTATGHMARCRLMTGLLEIAKGSPTSKILSEVCRLSAGASLAISTMKKLRAMSSDLELCEASRKYLDSI